MTNHNQPWTESENVIYLICARFMSVIWGNRQVLFVNIYFGEIKAMCSITIECECDVCVDVYCRRFLLCENKSRLNKKKWFLIKWIKLRRNVKKNSCDCKRAFSFKTIQDFACKCSFGWKPQTNKYCDDRVGNEHARFQKKNTVILLLFPNTINWYQLL